VQAAVEMDKAPRKMHPAPRAGVHVVKAGDTVWRIARNHGVTAAQIVRWNGLDRPDRIFPGEHLRVGAPAA
jgi:LysM repeat protein